MNKAVAGYFLIIQKIIIIFFFISFNSCGQKNEKLSIAPKAVELNNQAIKLVPYIKNQDSSKKAISLLDKATSIDSNYFLGHFNKLMFYSQLKQFDKIVLTNDKLIKLRPLAHDLYLNAGLFYEKIGDTLSSKGYFDKSLTICNAVLDTMKISNRGFVMITTNQAINLIMLNDSIKANMILAKLNKNQVDGFKFDEVEIEYIKSLMNKNKNELINSIYNLEKNY
jgi:tetratricopeptide (TPR) repeat protein